VVLPDFPLKTTFGGRMWRARNNAAIRARGCKVAFGEQILAFDE
jgi:hypothetical protein